MRVDCGWGVEDGHLASRAVFCPSRDDLVSCWSSVYWATVRFGREEGGAHKRQAGTARAGKLETIMSLHQSTCCINLGGEDPEEGTSHMAGTCSLSGDRNMECVGRKERSGNSRGYWNGPDGRCQSVSSARQQQKTFARVHFRSVRSRV